MSKNPRRKEHRDLTSSLRNQHRMHALSKEHKQEEKKEEVIKGTRPFSKESNDHKHYLLYASKQATSGRQEKEIAKGTRLGPLANAK